MLADSTENFPRANLQTTALFKSTKMVRSVAVFKRNSIMGIQPRQPNTIRLKILIIIVMIITKDGEKGKVFFLIHTKN